ncbi:MAG: preprotein translocase subunit SecE [Ktedonobacteraceae bacterium]
MASNMAEKKKSANPSRSASRSSTVEPKAANSAKDAEKASKVVSSAKESAKEEKAASSPRELAKEAKEVSRDRERSKRVAKKPTAKAPASWRVRLRRYRLIAFMLDAYFELRHKVTWPTAVEARNMVIIVILLSAAVGLVLGLVDLGLYQVFLLISRIGAP